MKCPKCSQELEQSGEIDEDGRRWKVYQCDRCTRQVDFFGVEEEVLLTFAVDEAGRLFDPATGDLLPPFSGN